MMTGRRTVRTVALLLGGASLIALSTVSPAWANSRDREFAGYLVHKAGKVHSAVATFNIPSTTCKTNDIAFGPGVTLQSTSLDATSVVRTGAYETVDCVSPGPAGSLYIELSIRGIARKDLPVLPSDVIHAVVKRSGKEISVVVTDKTSKVTDKAKGKAGSADSYAVIGDYDPETNAAPHARNTVTSFTGVTVDGVALSHDHPIAYNCAWHKPVQYKPSPVHGAKNFTITFHHG